MESNKKQNDLLGLILGNHSTVSSAKDCNNNNDENIENVEGIINRKLIMKSAMFWDSKERPQKIKSLFLTGIGLTQFGDTEDFLFTQLCSIELLSLSKNSIIHLHPLSQLNTLVSLNVSHNKVYDLSPISTLIELSQFYASNNSIKSIDSLAKLKKIKVLHLYNNKIQYQQDTFKTIAALEKLEELDIEQNPVCDQDFQELLSKGLLKSLKKLNQSLIRSSQKIKEMTCSNGFFNSSLSSEKFNRSLTSSMFFTNKGQAAKQTLDLQSTLYNFSKTKQLGSTGRSKVAEKYIILQKLEDAYQQLDEQFQEEIVKNVKLKSKLHEMLQKQKLQEQSRKQSQQQKQEIKNLKRKVKAMKQNLFTKNKKGELLRKLFEIQTIYEKPNTATSGLKSQSTTPSKSQLLNNKEVETFESTVWGRKFEADETIIIKRHGQIQKDEQMQISQSLNEFESTLVDLKNQLEYLS